MKTLMQWSLGLVLALPLATGAASRPATPFTDAELDQLLAPVALYPDTVLSHVLIAATVPEEVEEAAEWSYRHPDLSGQEAVDAVERMDWDPSVKALIAFPEVLKRMEEDPEWTANLGEAFLAQEATVMDRVQYLRDRASESGNLESLEHVRVVREREYIYLEPAVSHLVYVPYYDPWYVYGAWWWPTYPPHRWTYWAGYPARYYYGTTFFWGVGFHLAPTYYWSRVNWPARHVVVTRPHRHYSPTPGYSGHSNARRERHNSYSDHGPDRQWRGHDRRRDEPARSGRAERHSPQVRESRPDLRGASPAEPRREQRRNSADVRRELASRREHSRGAPQARSDERQRSGQPSSRYEPSPRASERAHGRASERSEVRDEVRRPSRDTGSRDAARPAPQAEIRERGRDHGSEQSGESSARGRGEPRTAPERNSGGRERGGQQQRSGRGRSER